MTKHTPGPWSSAPDRRSDNPRVKRRVLSNAGLVALAYSGIEGSDAETEANARLIAAAPDLLHALRALANTAENYEAEPREYAQALRFSVAQARDAIAQAEG